MTYDIKIYGEIVPFQEKWVTEQGGYVNLSFVQEQLSQANGEDIRVRIKSYGGDVEEGFSIYSELRRYAKDNNATVTTLAEGQCASIATVVFLAGDERLVTEFTQPFVHNAWCYAMGDSKTLQRVSADLEKVNNQIADHYAKHTDLTYEEARELMDDETSISPEECVRLRFATAIEEIQRPAALLLKINKSNNNVKMSKKAKKVQTKNQNDHKSFVKNLLKMFNKDVFTADNQILEFPDLEDDETVKVGDTALLDGSPAEGSVTIANGDVYVFEAGVLTEIKEEEAEDPQGADTGTGESETVEELKEEIQELEQENEELKEEVEELEDLLEKANAKITSLNNKIKNAVSKPVPDQKKDKGNAGGSADGNKSIVSEAVKNFKINKLKQK